MTSDRGRKPAAPGKGPISFQSASGQERAGSKDSPTEKHKETRIFLPAFPTRADDLRVSTASGSERVFRKGIIDGAMLATARGTDPEAQVETPNRKMQGSNIRPTWDAEALSLAESRLGCWRFGPSHIFHIPALPAG